ncbi:ABC transporter permease [Nocardia bhagyanarayanae]|uniref:ABC-2 type transport system permease protein n=1 Tax=Nocardia bhagyanarayanae TaxID=1215925 RepID=A0A543FF93_9NOCA|nr:ABC transporter permease [Nocardia bhagyanarayanae]TQM32520.1 ABC-2 type transport system permease protein [Nocardia bhagyanarayanae]
MNAVVTSRTPMRDNTSGVGTLLRFALWRERLSLPCWLLGVGALVAFQSLGSQRFYDTPQKLAQLRETIGASAATVAMGGPTRLLDTIGGEIVFEIFAYLAIVVALMNMFLVGRHTRSDEETGRAELLRSARVGRWAPTIASLALAGLADIAVALAVFAAAVGTGLPVAGSLLLGVVTAGVGITFAAVTAVAAQVFENPRSVYGAVGLALAAAYVARAVGDVGNGVASWTSPIGWGQRSYPYAGDRWWTVLLFAAATATLTAVAFLLLDRRDFGAGLFGYATGRPNASWALRSPLGLAWRLQRGSLAGWTVGVFALGAAYGSFADSIEDFLTDNPEIAAYLPGGATRAVDSYLSLTVSIIALLSAAFGITSVLRARGEETAGRAEPILAAPVSRAHWLTSHLAVAVVGGGFVLACGGFGVGLSYGLTIADAVQPLRMTGVALVYLPAVWSIVAIATVCCGWFPKAAVPLAWTVFAYCAVALLFTAAFDLPDWFDEASPFTHTPKAPLESVTAAPLLLVTAIAAAGLGVGFAGFRRRDTGF